MRKISKEELAVVLDNHKHWLLRDVNNWEYMRTDLSDADLRGADLRYADLSEANLRDSDLSGANLRYANLRGADLRYTDLRYANLSGADLRYANLRYTNLRYTDLRYANLSGADLSDADLSGAKNIPYIPYACPDTGSFIGYKKAGMYVVKLEILEDARRCSATGRKCRCDKAKVLDIQTIDGVCAEIQEVASDYCSNFIYKIGEIVEEPNFCEDRWNECAPGIHFFINRQEAAEY